MSLVTSTEPVVLARFDSLSVFAFECSTSTKRVHSHASIAYIRAGSMSYRPWGHGFDLVPGSMLLGRPGVEYFCEHGTDIIGRGLSFRFSPEFLDQTGRDRIPMNCDYFPPVTELAILGELAQSVVEGKVDVGLEEIGILLAHRLAAVVDNRKGRQRAPSLRQRQRIVDVALWIDVHLEAHLDLKITAGLAGMSLSHFLRVFTEVTGVTPHQYLIRCRLRHAARMLLDTTRSITDIAFDVGFNDLSNFIKAFHRASGVSPSHFRKLAHR